MAGYVWDLNKLLYKNIQELNSILACKRYSHGPRAAGKVSHMPQESAMLERQIKRAEEE